MSQAGKGNRMKMSARKQRKFLGLQYFKSEKFKSIQICVVFCGPQHPRMTSEGFIFCPHTPLKYTVVGESSEFALSNSSFSKVFQEKFSCLTQSCLSKQKVCF